MRTTKYHWCAACYQPCACSRLPDRDHSVLEPVVLSHRCEHAPCIPKICEVRFRGSWRALSNSKVAILDGRKVSYRGYGYGDG